MMGRGVPRDGDRALSLAGHFLALFLPPRGAPARPAGQCAPPSIERDAAGVAGRRDAAPPQQARLESLEQPHRIPGAVDAPHPFGHIDRAIHGTVLHDGVVVATWNLQHDPRAGTATLTISLGVALPKRAVASIEAEGRRFLRFKTDDAPDLEVQTISAT